MPSDMQTAPASNKGLLAGRIIGGLVILFLTFDAVFKFVKPAPAPVVETMAHLGWSLSLAPVLGIVLLVCVALYVIPITSVLGSILLTVILAAPLPRTYASAIHCLAIFCSRRMWACCSGVVSTCAKTVYAHSFLCEVRSPPKTLLNRAARHAARSPRAATGVPPLPVIPLRLWDFPAS
jgi:hypothetical protein